MFSEIDNHGGTVVGIYTGYSVSVSPTSPDPKGDAFAAGLNTEHTWPQSKGAGDLPARADLHHLFPSEIDANNARASFPFEEIPDQETDLWYRNRTVTATPDPEFIDAYSELDRSFPGTAYGGRWEAREEQKGNTARAMFYFYTVYRREADAADPAYFDVQKADLRAWNLADPVDEAEYERTCAIAPHQGGRVNPFVVDPTLVDRAYFGGVPVRLVSFAAVAEGDGVRLNWTIADAFDHAGFDVIRAGAGEERRINPGFLLSRERYTFLDRTGTAGIVYAYSLDAVARDGSRERFGPRRVRFPPVPLAAMVRPNPAPARGPIRFEAGGAARLTVEIFDLRGRRLRHLEGEGSVLEWNGRDTSGSEQAPGVYFARIRTDERTVNRRFVLLR